MASEFGLVYRGRSAARRRLGAKWYQVLHPRVHLGVGCELRSGSNMLVAKGASVVFGAGCVVDNGMTVECRGKIEVGARTVFGHHGTLAAAEFISIGEDCLIAEMVSIRDHDHSFTNISVPYNQQGQAIAPVRIGSNVWLGCKVTVIRGVSIGNNTVVGANAVVTHDLPSDCVAVGIPARIVRYLDPDKRWEDSR